VNFARPYQEHQRSIAEKLRAARASGQTRYQTTHSAREVDPTRLSDRQIADIALREAERYTQRIINQYNESLDKKG